MIAVNKIRHQTLNLPGFWRIIWYGKLRAITQNRTHPFINAFLGPLKADASGHKPISLKIQGPVRQILIPATNLLLLPLGTVLANGKLYRRPVESSLSEFQLQLNFSRSNLNVFGRISGDAEQYISPPTFELTDPENYKGLLLGVGYNGDSHGVIIPCVEIFRAFYCYSSRFALAILNGWFYDPERYIYNPAHTKISSDNRDAFLWLRKRMLDKDAGHIAKFAFDNYAMKQAQDIHSYAATVKIAHEDRLLRALPPFQDTVEIKGIGKRILSPDGQTRLILTRIFSCSWKPPYVNLTFDRDNDGRKNRYDDKPKIPTSPGIPNHKSPEDDPNDMDLTDDEFGNTYIPDEIIVPETLFPNENVNIQKAPQIETEYENEGATSNGKTDRWMNLLSTVDGKTSDELVKEAIIQGMQELENSGHSDDEDFPGEQDLPDDHEPSYGQYMELAEQLKKAHKLKIANTVFIDLWKNKGHPAKNWQDIRLHQMPSSFDQFPYAHLYRDADKRERRHYWLAKIRYEGRTRYVFDIEERQGRQDMAILVMWFAEESDIPMIVLQKAVMRIIETGRAKLNPPPYPELVCGTRKHTSKISASSVDRETEILERILKTLFATEPVLRQ